ncbi:MAG: diaminopimelate epimerase [Acidiferrobacterales bacterium]
MTRFTKMHGLGNDFVVFDGINQDINLSSDQIQRLADRHFGIGCDQVLLVEKATDPDMDFRYRIFNADGGEVAQCGNGARCFMRFVHDQGLTDKNEIGIETNSGNIFPRLLGDGLVTVNMGVPNFEPASIPYAATKRASQYTLDLDLNMNGNGQTIQLNILSLGNPHAVLQVDDIKMAPVLTLGPKIEQHPDFPERVNAGFMQVISRNKIAVRVFERGSGETQACGSGACAAVITGIQNGHLDAKVSASLTGGDLEITWEGEGNPVWLTGPATTVFEGSIDLGEL